MTNLAKSVPRSAAVPALSIIGRWDVLRRSNLFYTMFIYKGLRGFQNLIKKEDLSVSDRSPPDI